MRLRCPDCGRRLQRSGSMYTCQKCGGIFSAGQLRAAGQEPDAPSPRVIMTISDYFYLAGGMLTAITGYVQSEVSAGDTVQINGLTYVVDKIEKISREGGGLVETATDGMYIAFTLRNADLKNFKVGYEVLAMEPAKSAPPPAGKPSHKPEGCYIATCVYGSYDCPQVRTLRAFRDAVLRRTWYGRAFVRAYYAVSPTLVKRFGSAPWFRRLCKAPLDRLVARLSRQRPAAPRPL